MSQKDLGKECLNYFKNYISPEQEPEEGAEAVVIPRDFKAIQELKNTTKNTDTEKGSTFEDIIFSFLE